MESAATLDVLMACGACTAADVVQGKAILTRVVSMLSRMVESGPERTREEHARYPDGKQTDYEDDYDYEKNA